MAALWNQSVRSWDKGTIGAAAPLMGVLLGLAIFGMPRFALAEGFRCLSHQGDVGATVYHQVQPQLGTRNVAALILQDPRAEKGHQVVLRFLKGQSELSNQSAFYEAEMSPQAIVASSESRELAGVALQELETVQLAVQFTYGIPLKNGQRTRGQLTLVTRGGEKIDRELVCKRYLKH